MYDFSKYLDLIKILNESQIKLVLPFKLALPAQIDSHILKAEEVASNGYDKKTIECLYANVPEHLRFRYAPSSSLQTYSHNLDGENE